MFLWWGPELVQFYNDGYRPSLGLSGRHPKALGARGRDFWQDIWAVIGPEIDQVMATGVPTWHEDAYIPIERDGGRTDVWWTYGYSPVFDDDGSIQGTLVICQETTANVLFASQRDESLRTLQTERARLAAVFEKSPSGLAVLRGDNHVFEQTNPAYVQSIGGRDVVGWSLLDAFPEVRGQGVDTALSEVRATGVPYVGYQVPVAYARVPGAKPETRHLNLVYQRFAEADGTHSVFVHTVDVTEEVLAVIELRNAEAQLRDQFAKMPVATTLWERAADDFILIACNDAAEQVSPGIGTKVGCRRQDLFPNTEDVAEDFRRCLRENTIVQRSAELFGPPGAQRYLERSIGPQQPNRVLVHATDVTERTALETKLRRSQRMESVGLLAGGIAHDFNNLLTVIQAHARFLLEEVEETDSSRADIAGITQATARAAELTQQLLAFSRRQVLKPTYVDGNTLVQSVFEKLRDTIGADITVVTSLTAESGKVLIDAAQLERALLNLALNARDAMRGGGTLTVRTTRLNVAPGSVGLGEGLAPGDCFVIELVDTGIGMDSDLLGRAFEPFFGTKDEAKGQGMGLATVYGIVKQSGGHITLESRPGAGTTARMIFPAAVMPAIPAAEPAPAARVNHESILLVEDEPSVRAVAKRILTNAGYTVIDVPSGRAGLAISDDPSIPLHMVLSDVVMPDLGGAEVVERVRARRPGISAAVMSGYTDDDVMRRGIFEARVAFLHKPFTPAQLTRFVRDTLDGRAPTSESASPASEATKPAL